MERLGSGARSLSVRIRRAHRGRTGGSVLALTIIAALGSVQRPFDVLLLPVRLPFVWAASWALVWVVARIWDGRPGPAAPAFSRRGSATVGQYQLRLDPNGQFIGDRRGYLWSRRVFFTATCCPPRRVDPVAFGVWAQLRHTKPVRVAQDSNRSWWWYRDQFWWDNAGYSPGDVKALIHQRESRHQRRLEQAHTMLRVESSPRPRRQPIPREVKRLVFERDGGECVDCGSRFDIHYDHIIPLSLGGSSTVENLQLLCAPCNQQKGVQL